VSSRTARAAQRNPVSEPPPPKKKKKERKEGRKKKKSTLWIFGFLRFVLVFFFFFRILGFFKWFLVYLEQCFRFFWFSGFWCIFHVLFLGFKEF
jgi:hypothetical protein